MTDEELKQLIASNTKTIKALSSTVAQERKERQRFERRLYQAMSQMAEGMAQMSERVGTVAAAQASFWEVQADYYRRLEEMDEGQAQIIEILNRLTPKN